MNLVLCGAAQCQVCPRPFSSPSRRKMSPEMVSKEGLGLRAILSADRHLPDPAALSVPSLGCQNSILTWAP